MCVYFQHAAGPQIICLPQNVIPLKALYPKKLNLDKGGQNLPTSIYHCTGYLYNNNNNNNTNVDLYTPPHMRQVIC